MYVLNEDIGKFEKLKEVKTLNTIEDIGTFTDTFMKVKEKFSYKDITGVLEDDEGFYHFIIRGKGSFDFYGFLNSVCEFRISCIESSLLHPDKSRGIKDLYQEDNPDTTSYMDEDDTPTGYLEGDLVIDNNVYFLVRKNSNDKVEITPSGLSIGRSSSKANYVIKSKDNISRLHCILFVKDGYLKVQDLKSLNGTFVNGRRLYPNEEVLIHKGDNLTVADEEFVIQ